MNIAPSAYDNSIGVRSLGLVHAACWADRFMSAEFGGNLLDSRIDLAATHERSQSMDIFSDLAWRGLVSNTTDDKQLAEWLRSGSRTLYAGFDPTAESLHVGHLMALMILRRFQKAGHRPIALVGGATGMIGDPSGKSQERNLLSVEALRANVEGMREQIRSFLDFDCGSTSALLVNNYDWVAPWSVPRRSCATSENSFP